MHDSQLGNKLEGGEVQNDFIKLYITAMKNLTKKIYDIMGQIKTRQTHQPFNPPLIFWMPARPKDRKPDVSKLGPAMPIVVIDEL